MQFECPSTSCKLGQSFVQCYDVASLKLHTWKDADREMERSLDSAKVNQIDQLLFHACVLKHFIQPEELEPFTANSAYAFQSKCKGRHVSVSLLESQA